MPCRSAGVPIFYCQDGRLLPAREPLRCVRDATSVCVNTADTVFVGDFDTHSVYLVRVSSDTVVGRLDKPAEARDPYYMSVQGQIVLVCYDENTLVTYRIGSPTPDRVLRIRDIAWEVTSITSDSRSSSFIVTDGYNVFVLDDKLLFHRIYTDHLGLQDCAVVQSQLWLGYRNGVITVLTSR